MSPAIYIGAFPATPSKYFWTSSFFSSNYKWAIGFEEGNLTIDIDYGETYVRCVRGVGRMVVEESYGDSRGRLLKKGGDLKIFEVKNVDGTDKLEEREFATADLGQFESQGLETRIPRYVRSTPGPADEPIVYDNITTVRWQGCPAELKGDDCAKDGSYVVTKNWDEANAYCEGLSWGGLTSGWSLPPVKYLSSLISFRNSSAPYIDSTAFPRSDWGGWESFYWAKRGLYFQPTRRMFWGVDFHIASIYPYEDIEDNYVRCIHN